MILELRDVVREFVVGDERIRVLDRVSLTLAHGEFVAILGPSGSGKSTLIELAAGLGVPDSGDVLFKGNPVHEVADAEWRREQLGVVFQSPPFLAGLTAVQSVAGRLVARGTRPSQAERIATRWLTRLGLEARLDRQPDQLSGGERQRVAIARALVTDPPLLLADEPTGSLDRRRSIETFELLRNLAHDDGRAVLLVTHDETAAQMVDRAILLQDGRARELGVDEVPDSPRESSA